MQKNEKIEYTPEGLLRVCNELTYLPEEQRKSILLATIKAVIRS